MAQPEIKDLKPIYKNCDWSQVWKFPYPVTSLIFEGGILVDEDNEISYNFEKLDDYRVKISIISTQIANLENKNYEVYLMHRNEDGSKPTAIHKGKVPIAPFGR